jgi:predicted Zn-dependent protease
VSRHKGKVEFLPVGAQRDRFPPLPLPSTGLSVFEPPAEQINTLFSVSVAGIEDTLYVESLRTLEKKLRQQRGSRAVRLRNQIGVLHARFGNDRAAETALNRCLSDDPDFSPAYLNLANLKMVRGEIEEAARVARRGLERSPEFPLLNVLLALYYNRKGQLGEARKYLERVRAASPELAARYDYLADAGSEESRAGIAAAAAGELPLIWDAGEEVEP